MECIRVEREGSVQVVHLARGKANALTAPMVDEIVAAVEQAAEEPAIRALVLASDSPRVFCGGFDVGDVFAYDRERMTAFFGRFMTLFERIRTLPKPAVAALSGHAFAGGAILALACDVRIMADNATIAVNEVDLGVVLPVRMIRAMAATGHPDLMRSMLLGGEVVSSTRALAGGVANETVPAVDVLAVALTRARVLGDKPPHAFAAHKRALDPIGPITAEEAARGLEAVIDVWFGAEATTRRQALIEKLAAKSR